MGKAICVNQTLHGYANGHQLLKASCELSMSDRKKMDELSDLNGMVDEKSFIPYYTGYPIANGENYVIAKTWYAYEKRRPGCVWTHSIILSTADVNEHMNIDNLLDIFKRPGKEGEEDYSCQIFLGMENKKCLDYQHDVLDYIVSTLLSSDRPKYVVVRAEEYIKEFFMVLCTMPYEVLRSFTFSTMSYSDRIYGEQLFGYQMIAEKNKYLFARQHRDVCICEDIYKIERYPYWVRRYSNALVEGRLCDLNDFIAQYNNREMSLKLYNCLFRIFFAMSGKRMSMEEYFDSIELVMPELKMEYWQQTVELILEERFYGNYFEKHEYEMIEMMDMGKFKMSLGSTQKLAKKVIRNSPEKIYPMLKKFISGQLKEKERETVEYIISDLRADDLKTVSRMEENICVVLVRMNVNLMLSKYIWQQPKDFQRTLIYSCNRQIPTNTLHDLLVTIFRHNVEDLVMDLYCVFGDRVLEQVYRVLDEGLRMDETKSDTWMEILMIRPLLLITNMRKIPLKSLRFKLFLRIDLHTDNLLETVGKDVWETIYRDLSEEGCEEELKFQLSLKFFIVIFSCNRRFTDDFVRDVITPVYRKMEKNKLSIDEWKQIRDLLPEVEDCCSWDRCLRVRLGMEQKGYNLKEF